MAWPFLSLPVPRRSDVCCERRPARRARASGARRPEAPDRACLPRGVPSAAVAFVGWHTWTGGNPSRMATLRRPVMHPLPASAATWRRRAPPAATAVPGGGSSCAPELEGMPRAPGPPVWRNPRQEYGYLVHLPSAGPFASLPPPIEHVACQSGPVGSAAGRLPGPSPCYKTSYSPVPRASRRRIDPGRPASDPGP
jgi:hypothetical protein